MNANQIIQINFRPYYELKFLGNTLSVSTQKSKIILIFLLISSYPFTGFACHQEHLFYRLINDLVVSHEK